MNCPWLERVALAMDDVWTPEVEAHARSCSECSGLLEDREWLRSAPPLPLPVAVHKRRVWWPGALAAAAAVAVVSGITLIRPLDIQPLGPAAVRHPVAPVISAASRPIAARRAAARPAAARPVSASVRRTKMARREFDPERLAESLVASLNQPPTPSGAMTIYTDDPDVVIMLLPSKGDTEDD